MNEEKDRYLQSAMKSIGALSALLPHLSEYQLKQLALDLQQSIRKITVG